MRRRFSGAEVDSGAGFEGNGTMLDSSMVIHSSTLSRLPVNSGSGLIEWVLFRAPFSGGALRC
jgi:hypothetical protein